ncbi:MAG: TonB family protein [Acidobacteriota bacterium]
MFEYAIGHYQKHPPSKRLLASWVISVLSHVGAVLVLYLYPQLLQGGANEWFRQIALPRSEVQNKKSYNVTFMTKMEAPSAQELKKLIYDWEKAKAKEAEIPPIRINLPRANADDFPPPLPKPRSDAPAAPGNPLAAAAGTPPAQISTTDVPRTEPPQPKNAAPPGAPNVEPKQIPKGVADASSPASGSTVTSGSGGASQTGPPGSGTKDSKGPGQQIRAQGPTFFDDKGFNLGDYAMMLRERIKERWFIPSNLRTYQGSVTVIFYISKDGQVSGVKAEVRSGNDSLDISALSAVFGSNPFPPLPKGFPADRVGARLVFAYNERQ